MGFIYLVRNMINARPYVGQTIEKNPENRWKKHVPGSVGPYLLRAYEKYGRSNFSYSILCECSDEYLNDYEKSYIKLYSSMCPSLGGIGYNMTLGGGSGGKLCEETRQKISIGNTGKRLTEETKQKIAIKATGRPKSEETRRKIGAASRGRILPPRSEEHRKNLSISNTGKTRSLVSIQKQKDAAAKRREAGYVISEETRTRLSKSKSGEAHPMHGKTHTQEAKDAISKALKGRKRNPESVKKSAESRRGRKSSSEENARKMKPVEQWSVDEKTLIGRFNSVSEAAGAIGVSVSALSSCLSGRNKTSAGFKWKFSKT